jgi:cell division protein FtsB
MDPWEANMVDALRRENEELKAEVKRLKEEVKALKLQK